MTEQKKKEEEIIKSYKMVEGDYTIQVRILEAQDLIPTNSGFSIFKSKGSAVNAFVEVKIGTEIKRTKVVKGQLSPIFNALMSFKLKDMKKAQLTTATIQLSAYDKKNALLGNTIIGSYELDISEVYFSLNHEMYRTYFALSDPTDEREGQMGFILANIAVLGPNDEPIIHDVTTEKSADATKGQTMVPKKIKQWPHQIQINLLRGEHMVPLDLTTAEIDAYITLKYGGSKIKSDVKTSRNPEWFQQLNIGCMLPNQSKFIELGLYDRDLIGDDDLAGIVQIPFVKITEQESDPVWYNLYGAPLRGKGKEADLMNLFGTSLGSHYRGRILLTHKRFDARESKTFKQDLKYQFPERPMPISEQKSYLLRVDLLEGHEFPTRDQIIIQVKIGPYLMVSQPTKLEDGTALFYENLPDKKILFPKSIDQIPDIIIYMADDNIEDRRHTFIRIKAEKVLDKPVNPQILKLKEDRSLDLITDDEFPGFLYANIQLMSLNPGQRVPFQPDKKQKIAYELRVFLYLGRDIPPADANGSCDPLVKVRCAGQLGQSKTCNQTLNPGWYETIKLNVKLYPLDQDQIVPSGMFVMVFDEDQQEGKDTKYDLIGRIWITLQPELIKFHPQGIENASIEMFYRKPKWYNILYDATDEVQGRLLLAYALIKQEEAALVPDEVLYPESNQGQIHLFGIGLRNIEKMVGDTEPSNLAVSFDISGDSFDPIFTDYKKVKNEGVNINRLISLDIDIPRNQNFCPVIDTYVWNKEPGKDATLLGVSTIDLSKLLINYYRALKLPPDAIMEEDTEQEDEEAFIDFLDGKKRMNKQGQIVALLKEGEAEQQEEEEVIDLDKIQLDIPWELPIKNQAVDQEQFQAYQERKVAEQEKLKKMGEELILKSQVRSNQLNQNSQMIDMKQQIESKLNSQQSVRINSDQKSQQISKQNSLQNSQQKILSRKPSQQFVIKQQTQKSQYMDEMPQEKRMMSQNSVARMSQISNISNKKSFREELQGQQQDDSQVQLIQELPHDSQEQHLDNLDLEDDKPVFKPTVYRSENPYEQPRDELSQPQDEQSVIVDSHHHEQPQQQYKSIRSQMPPPDQDSMQYIALEDEKSLRSQQSNMSKGQIQNDLRHLGSQRSLQALGGVNKDVVFNQDQHFKNQEELKKQSEQLSRRDSYTSSQLNKEKLDKLPKTKVLYQNFKIKSNLEFSQASKLSSHALSMNSAPKEDPNSIKKEKKKKPKIKDLKRGKFIGLLAFMSRKKKNTDVETYEDYDTDPGEDLNINPPWLENRKFLKDDLEDFMKPSKRFMKLQIMQGQSRGHDTKFNQEKAEVQQVCEFKFIFLEEKKGVDINQKKEMYARMMRPKIFSVRLYFLQGVEIQTNEENPNLYLKLKTAEGEKSLKDKSLRNGTNSPQFYFPYEVTLEVPGSSIIEVEVWVEATIQDEFVGKTVIDLEDRYFALKWHQFEQKPIENRNLKDEGGSSVGRLQMWIDLVEKVKAKDDPIIKITAPPRYEFELRSIIYETRDCVFKDELEKSNDLYCKAGIANQNLMETDIHWRCRAKGSFNWRIKSKVSYPMLPDDYGSDRYKVQLWDKDIVGSDELLGETQFNLNTHKLIDKAVKRLVPVQIKQRIREKGGIITDKFWLSVYHPDAVDEEGQKISQGQVKISFELLPMTEAQKLLNGNGRDPPNVYPPLDEPTGRLKFDIMNPAQFIKDLVGPELYGKVCKFFIVALCLGFGCTFGWMFLGPLIATAIFS